MFIMSKNNTFPNSFKFALSQWWSLYRYFIITHLQSNRHSSVGKATDFVSRRPRIGARRRPNFSFFAFFLFLYIQMFCYAIMKLFITLHKNVNKSRTSAGRLSLSSPYSRKGIQRDCKLYATRKKGMGVRDGYCEKSDLTYNTFKPKSRFIIRHKS
jgi:hypothetical protein